MRSAGRRRVEFLILCLCFGAPQVCLGDLVSAGDISFIGFNVDGNDDFAVVLLADAAVGNEVYFNDNEWVGSDFNGFGESEIKWTVNTALAAGTVVSFSNLSTTPTATVGATNVGSITPGPMYAVNTMSLSGGEAIYAFTRQTDGSVDTFLAAFSNDERIYDGANGTLTGTGLSEGSTAVLVARNGADSANGGQYTGSRSSETSFDDYLSLIGDINGNWGVNYTSGTGFVPFNSTAFTLMSGQSTPEPGSLALMALLAPLGLTMDRCRKRRMRKNVVKSCEGWG